MRSIILFLNSPRFVSDYRNTIDRVLLFDVRNKNQLSAQLWCRFTVHIWLFVKKSYSVLDRPFDRRRLRSIQCTRKIHTLYTVHVWRFDSLDWGHIFRVRAILVVFPGIQSGRGSADALLWRICGGWWSYVVRDVQRVHVFVTVHILATLTWVDSAHNIMHHNKHFFTFVCGERKSLARNGNSSRATKCGVRSNGVKTHDTLRYVVLCWRSPVSWRRLFNVNAMEWNVDRDVHILPEHQTWNARYLGERRTAHKHKWYMLFTHKNSSSLKARKEGAANNSPEVTFIAEVES